MLQLRPRQRKKRVENRLSRGDSVGSGLDHGVYRRTMLYVDPGTYSGYCIGWDTSVDLEAHFDLQRLMFLPQTPWRFYALLYCISSICSFGLDEAKSTNSEWLFSKIWLRVLIICSESYMIALSYMMLHCQREFCCSQIYKLFINILSLFFMLLNDCN